MKVKATANISGKTGDRAIGDEFTVTAADGRELIERGLVVEVGTTSTKSGSTKKRASSDADSAGD